MSDGLGVSWRLGLVVQGKGKTAGSVGDSRGEETEERNRGYTREKKEGKRRGKHVGGIKQ